jgi:hypothetical protein
MKTILQALVWKEWRENRWKLVAVLGVLLLSLTVLWSTSRVLEFSSIQIALLLPIIPITVLIATTTVAQEQSHGTLAFLGALPVSPRRVAIAKLLAGLATCLLPVFFVLAMLLLWRSGWEWLGADFKTSMRVASEEWRGPFNLVSNWFAATATAITLWVVCLFLWSAAAGVRRADEVSAGAAALALMAFAWLFFIAIAFWIGDGEPDNIFREHPTLTAFASAIAPGGFPHTRIWNFTSGWMWWAVIALHFTVLAGLAAWFVMRFGSVPGPRIKSQRWTLASRRQIDWLGPPRRSPFTAIAWKQFRESGPLALAGLGCVALIVVAGVFITARTQRDLAETQDVAAMSMFFGSIYLGALTTVVIGVGVFLRDLESGVHTFWRSRPIEPNSWYWIKFVTGIAVIAVTFLLPLLIAPALTSTRQRQFDSPDGISELFWLQATAAVTILAAYSMAVMTTCLTRSAVFATILTMVGLYVAAMFPMLLVLAYCWITIGVRADFPLNDNQIRPWILASLLIATMISMIVGWLSVRNDWHTRGGR